MLAAIVLAFALATDAAAAAAVRGLVAKRVRVRDALLVAALTGGFQAGMAALGWLGGRTLGEHFALVDHWIAFGVLAGLGLRAVIGALRGGAPEERGEAPTDDAAAACDAFALGPLVLLAIATSIDALAAGVSVPLLAPAPAITLALIGGVTFALAAAATYVGRLAGARLGARLELLGGVALIAIGTKILVEHLG